MKKTKQKHQNAKSIGEKLKTKGLMFLGSFFSCDLQDLKFWYVKRKVFCASLLYWVDFNKSVMVQARLSCTDIKLESINLD